MNRNNPNEASNNLSNIRKEIARLCNLQSSRNKDFRNLGFDCLIRKLKEVEQILNGLREIPIVEQESPISSTRINPLGENMNDSHQDACRSESRSHMPPLNLPNDLTPYTKSVLNEIYLKFGNSVDECYEHCKLAFKQAFEEAYRIFDYHMNAHREKQKKNIRMFIEDMLEIGVLVEGAPSSNSLIDDLSPIPHYRSPNCTGPPQQMQHPQNSPIINMEAVKETLSAPGIDPHLKQQFFQKLKSIDDILTDIMNQAGCKGSKFKEVPPVFRELPTEPPDLDMPECSLDSTFKPLTCTR